jgi:hypothetical protein
MVLPVLPVGGRRAEVSMSLDLADEPGALFGDLCQVGAGVSSSGAESTVTRRDIAWFAVQASEVSWRSR